MNIKIINIDTIHNNEYVLHDVKEIIAVDFFKPAHKDCYAATLICKMKD